MRRVKKLEKLLKVYLEQSTKTGRFYEHEMGQKDMVIDKLQKTVDEYEKVSYQKRSVNFINTERNKMLLSFQIFTSIHRTLNKDQMIISFRDKTISQLKDESGINLDQFNNHQIEILKKENELLSYKVTNNPEIEGFKSKCSKLEKDISDLKSGSELGGVTIKQLLNAMIGLNEKTQQYLTDYCETQHDNPISNSESKRISDVSFFNIEEK